MADSTTKSFVTNISPSHTCDSRTRSQLVTLVTRLDFERLRMMNREPQKRKSDQKGRRDALSGQRVEGTVVTLIFTIQDCTKPRSALIGSLTKARLIKMI